MGIPDLVPYLPKLPHKAFGVDLDDALAYTTQKEVRIKDRHLGCFQYSWYVFVAAWVVGFQICYGNHHYKLYDVKGQARITIQQPTEGCNPNDNDCVDRLTPISELPYCKNYAGKNRTLTKHASKCIYADQHELLPEGMLEGEMFVPTRIDTMVEERVCRPSEANNFHCDKMWKNVRHDEDVYVADIEDFTLMVVSTYYRAGIKGDSTDHQGFYYECRKDGKVVATDECEQDEREIVPISCLKGLDCGFKATKKPPKAPNAFLSKRRTMNIGNLRVEEDDVPDSKDAFAIPSGDIFSLRKLVQLAGLDLDGSPNKAGDILRKRGTIIAIKIEYANLEPWKGTVVPGYIYKVVERPTAEMKTEMYSRKEFASDGRRTIENRHGIYLVTTIDGSFGRFNIVFLLVMMTTSLALLSVGRTMTDLLVSFSSYKDNKQELAHNEYTAHSTPGEKES